MTKKLGATVKFVLERIRRNLKQIKVIAFTHKNFPVESIGTLHLNDEVAESRLQELKASMGLDELMYLSTCNRVEFILVTAAETDRDFLNRFFEAFQPEWEQEQIQNTADKALFFKGDRAIQHIFEVASSIDSMVIGEREIITQVRNSFEQCRKWNLTGDTIRLMIRKTIETAKQVYTETEISSKPVSVVTLAYHNLKQYHLSDNPRVLMVGAGMTNQNMARFLSKHEFGSFAVFNRTLSKAQKLANDVSGEAYSLEELKNYDKGFDVLITCTGSSEPVITEDVYTSLIKNEAPGGTKKIIIDLAVPFDTSEEVSARDDNHFISVEVLREMSQANQKERAKDLFKAEEIIAQNLDEFDIMFRTRQLERKLSEVPKAVKEIKQTAMNAVFAKDLSKLDKNSLDVLEKVINYMEKKYVSVPMKMAKEILIKE